MDIPQDPPSPPHSVQQTPAPSLPSNPPSPAPASDGFSYASGEGNMDVAPLQNPVELDVGSPEVSLSLVLIDLVHTNI